MIGIRVPVHCRCEPDSVLREDSSAVCWLNGRCRSRIRGRNLLPQRILSLQQSEDLDVLLDTRGELSLRKTLLKGSIREATNEVKIARRDDYPVVRSGESQSKLRRRIRNRRPFKYLQKRRAMR